ncbi:hypothetical protein DY000_02007644 [Brassica cretica]|uniref:Uncharacterized protein n=1 Tax=Brassica cretica TaxID=69181 RepID=A0ABQ7C3K9_BRACR|nr:hypothetical protein DY000_02007644 [Brassica cretica]
MVQTSLHHTSAQVASQVQTSLNPGPHNQSNVASPDISEPPPAHIVPTHSYVISHFGDLGSIYGDSRLSITAGQTETAPVVVLGGVDACRWRQDAKAPARTPLLHGDNRSLVHEPLLR